MFAKNSAARVVTNSLDRRVAPCKRESARTGQLTIKEPLHEGQIAVLRWVADGCPEDKWGGHDHKLTANALAGRRLVKVSKRSGGWHADLLPAGTYDLAHGEYPPGHWNIRKNATASTPSVVPRSPLPSARPPARPTPRSPRTATGEPKPTLKLVNDVVTAGGRLVREVSDGAPNYSHLAGIINGRKLVPDGDQS